MKKNRKGGITYLMEKAMASRRERWSNVAKK
jgi:hypothetical protein